MSRNISIILIANTIFLLGFSQNLWLLIPLNIPMIVSLIMGKIYNDYAELEKRHNDSFEQFKQLKEQLEAYKMEAEEGKEINAELKAELEQEKAWHKTSDEISKVNSEYTEKLKAENDELKEQFKLAEPLYQACNIKDKKINKLKQTLTEIKDIAEVLITTTDEYDSCYYKDKCSKCEVKKDCQYFKVEQILQKIGEVEDEQV